MATISQCPTCGAPIEHKKLGIALKGNVASKADMTIVLPRRQARVLKALIANWPYAASKDKLVEAAYDGDEEPDEARVFIESHVSKLRRHLKPFGIGIKSSRYEGYRLIEAD